VPDVEAACRYARERLERELPRYLTYHTAAHTSDDVVPATERLAWRCGLPEESRRLLLTAAWFHDLGFLECRQGHEDVSIRIAREELPRFGYGPDHVDAVARIILATRMPQSPRSLEGRILADADLDTLGREDFFDANRRLREELSAFGVMVSDEDWYREQLVFLASHRYFTDEARAERDAGKARNIEAVRALLAPS
jgi:uncharacterized protein